MVRSALNAGSGPLSGGSESAGRGVSAALTAGGVWAFALSCAASLLGSHAKAASANAATRIHKESLALLDDFAPPITLFPLSADPSSDTPCKPPQCSDRTTT